jgi:hypothetical protein
VHAPPNTHGNGGPEWWAWKWQQERRQVLELRARLHARLEPIIQLAIDFLCVHTGEGSWTANTGNGYYGGLQFNLDFMRTYGARYLAAHGTADNWEPAEQIATAIVAHTTRGFTPWPNTARRCGLLK